MIETQPFESREGQEVGEKKELNIEDVASPILARLIEEVRNKEVPDSTAYNRFHNRHNR